MLTRNFRILLLEGQRFLWVAAAAMALLSASEGMAQTLADSSASEGVAQTLAGSLASVRGSAFVIPAKTDSTTARFATRPDPFWARAIDVPYLVATYPIHLAGQGVEGLVDLSGDLGLTHLFRRFFARRLLPPYTSIGIRAGGEDGYGATIGVAYPEMPGKGSTYLARAGATTRGDFQVSLGASRGTPKEAELQIGGLARRKAHVRYFGLGESSLEEDESFYREEIVTAGLSGRRRLAGALAMKGDLLFSSLLAKSLPEDDDEEPLEDVFAGELPPGFPVRSSGVTGALELVHDDTEEAMRPEAGGVRRARVSYFKRTGTSSDDVEGAASLEGGGSTSGEPRAEGHWTVRGELQQFVPLWYTKRVLALRMAVTKIVPQGRGDADFQRLLTNDDPDLLRGYMDGRFRDQGLATATAEYRWPIWALDTTPSMGADAYLFADTGQVFREWGEIGDELRHSFGGGVRIGSSDRFVGRVEFAKSEEGHQIRLRFDQMFQFERPGLLRGGHPIPER